MENKNVVDGIDISEYARFFNDEEPFYLSDFDESENSSEKEGE